LDLSVAAVDDLHASGNKSTLKLPSTHKPAKLQADRDAANAHADQYVHLQSMTAAEQGNSESGQEHAAAALHLQARKPVIEESSELDQLRRLVQEQRLELEQGRRLNREQTIVLPVADNARGIDQMELQNQAASGTAAPALALSLAVPQLAPIAMQKDVVGAIANTMHDAFDPPKSKFDFAKSRGLALGARCAVFLDLHFQLSSIACVEHV
jgi:hypothetical protein